MNTFNPIDPPRVEVENRDEEILVRLDDETLGFGPSTDGFRITNDWNDRHFSLSIYDNSVLYELSSDSDGDNLGTGDLPPEAVATELYSAVRSIEDAEFIPLDFIGVEYLHTLDIEGARSYLSESGVVDFEDNLSVDPEAWRETENEVFAHRPETIRFLDEAFDPIPVGDIRESGEVVFFNIDPGLNYFYVVLLLPGEYVEVIHLDDLANALTDLGGSPLMNYLNRSLERD